MRPIHWLVLVLIALVLFGAQKLPDLARSLGQSARILRKELKEDTSSLATQSEAQNVNKSTGELS